MPNITIERVDTWDMVVVHRYFRREFALLPELVRGVAARDGKHALLVGDWVAELITSLHHHHTGEDELLWPVLLQRVTLAAELVFRMEAQHVRVSTLLDSAAALLPAWQGGAEVDVRDRLAAVLAEVAGLLDEHLDEEEQQILPLVEKHLTTAEWAELGDRGKDSMPKGGRKALVVLAAILLDASPQERTRFLKMLPLPVRTLYRVAGQRTYRAAINRLRRAR